MFSAVLRGKAGHWFEGGRGRSGQPWRQAVRIEDTLTALVFDALGALAGDVVAGVLGAAVSPHLDLEWLSDDTFEVLYWPTLDGDVEPDVLLVDENQRRLLVVESKLGSLQAIEQLRRELAAVRSEYPEHSIQLLAVGGENLFVELRALLASGSSDAAQISALSWSALAEEARKNANTRQRPFERRALAALVDGLEWFGYRRLRPFQFPVAFNDIKIDRLRSLVWVPRKTARESFGARWLPEVSSFAARSHSFNRAASRLSGWRLVHE